jgi:hypothetical protein
VNAYKADDSEKPTVILHVEEFRLPEILRHIEAGRIVLVIPATQRPRKPPSNEEAHPVSPG